METISYNASYLEELIYLEGILNRSLKKQYDITDEDEVRQFYEVVYWHAVRYYLNDVNANNDDYVESEYCNRICSEFDKLCEREELDQVRRELGGLAQGAGRHIFGLHRRISSDIKRCKDMREWLCQLKTFGFYLNREEGVGGKRTGILYRETFTRFLLNCVVKVNAGDAVIKAMYALEEDPGVVKVMLSGTN